MTKRRVSAALGAVLAIFIAACGGTPGEDRPNEQAGGTPAEQVKTDGFEDLGPVTLRVVSSEGSGGPREAIQRLTRQFEAKYPNVNVEISFRDFSSWIKQAKLAAASDNPPDVFAGNQGYQLDGELVKAGLILPLDEYAKAYGWDQSYTPETMQQFTWSEDGRTFGEGTLWGVAQTGQSTGVFANMAKLREAGVDPAQLRTFDDFDKALATLRRSLPADEPVIALGNKDQYGAIHLWGMIQGAYTPAQDVRDWIFHKPGATFDTPGNLRSLQKLKEWADKGYLGQGDAFNARNDAEAAAAFGRGNGALMLGGNWNASIAKEGLGRNAGFFNMPPGESGQMVAIGSTSTPLHISAKSKQPDLAAAYIDALTGPSAAPALVATQQVPAATDATAEPADPLGRQVMEGWQQLVEDGGLTLYPDWSSPTMLQTMGQSFQEMLAGRITPQEVVERTQADWDEYDQELGAN
ncbi:MAG TPA: extracellular solute-binding protein [Solirubrobacteraceae bacterium]|nr:extracellular solute-binding protein [Solirubrobacteraceae bacterium]